MPPENSTVTSSFPFPEAPARAKSEADIAAARKKLRNAGIAAREALPEALRRALTARIETHLDALLGHLAPARIAFCWPWRGEVDLVPWAHRWLATDPARRAALPIVRAVKLTSRPLADEWARRRLLVATVTGRDDAGVASLVNFMVEPSPTAKPCPRKR